MQTDAKHKIASHSPIKQPKRDLASEISGTIGQIISTPTNRWSKPHSSKANIGTRRHKDTRAPSDTTSNEYLHSYKTLTIKPTSDKHARPPNIISTQSTNTENTLFYLKTKGISTIVHLRSMGQSYPQRSEETGGDPSQHGNQTAQK